MPSNGNSLRKDDATGFLQPSENYSIAGFTADKKTQFFALFEECGDIGKAMIAIGLDRRTFYTAMNTDSMFKKKFKESVVAMKWTLEGTMFHNGKTARGFMDRIAWLRRWFPEEYGQKTVIEHQTKDVENIFDSVMSQRMENGTMITVEDLNAPPKSGDAPPTK